MKLIFVEAFRKRTQIAGVRNEIDEIFAPILLWLKMYGLQILDSNWSWSKNVLVLICAVLLVIYPLFGTYIFLIEHSDNILLFTEALYTLIMVAQYALKTYFFLFYRSNFRNVYSEATLTVLSKINEISTNRTAPLLNQVRRMVKVFLLIVLVTTFNYLVPVTWHYCNGRRVTLSRTTATLMPMTSPYFELSLFLHLIYLIMIAFVTMMVDFWFVFFTHLYCESIDCIVKILRVQKNKEECETNYAYRLNENLRKFYMAHVDLMRYLNILQDMYKWQLLVPLTTVLVSLCIFLLAITEELNLQIALVMLPIGMEVFAYNILGERINTKARETYMALLNFDWTSMRLKDKKNYYIIICYMGKNFSLKTALGVELSLVTISSVLKTSYQTFAIFNTMKS